MPDEVQDTVGYALHLAQTGNKHPQAKSLKGFGGSGVLEVVEDSRGGTYRATYTVRMPLQCTYCTASRRSRQRASSRPNATWT